MPDISGEILLPSLGVSSNVRGSARIVKVLGVLRPGNTVLLQFIGPPMAVVEWSIQSGSGQLEVDKDYTDNVGVAQARLIVEAEGPVVVRVRYGA